MSKRNAQATPSAAAPAKAPADLAGVIETVLADKSYGRARYAQAVAAGRTQASAAGFSVESLMADLSAARQARAAEPKAKAPRRQLAAGQKSRSLLDQAFVLGAIAVTLTALLALSPTGRELLAPVARLLQ